MRPLNDDCRQVDAIVWDGVEFRSGDRISFDDRVWKTASTESHIVRVLGTITELWIETWRDTERVYAETDVPEPILNSTKRVWFNRDKVAHASELEQLSGAAPEGALW